MRPQNLAPKLTSNKVNNCKLFEFLKYPLEPTQLLEILERVASTETGVVYIQPDGSERFQSYQHLLEESKRIWARLKQFGLKPQDKIIFINRSKSRFYPSFLGLYFRGVGSRSHFQLQ